MKRRQDWLALILLFLGLVPATALWAQSKNRSEMVGADKSISVGAKKTQRDAAKSAIKKIQAAVAEMREQEKTLHRLTGQTPSGVPMYLARTKSIEGEHEPAKESQKSTGAVTAKKVEPTPVREAAARSSCTNNLKQMTLAVDEEVAKLRNYYQEQNDPEGLKLAQQLTAQVKQLHRAIDRIPAKPDAKADKKAVEELAAALDGLEERVALLLPAIQKVR